MSADSLYHAFGLKGYCVHAIRHESNEIVLKTRQPRESLRCPVCGSARVFSQGQSARRFRTLPIGTQPVIIELAVPRVRCRDCGLVRQVKIPFAPGSRHYTKAFERYALELARITTTKHAAQHLGVSWDTIRDIERRYLEKHFSKPKLKHLKRIAIDEIAVRKGHRYLTLVLDLDSGRVVYVGKGRKKQSLDDFWKRLAASRAKVEAVATDMSPAYIGAVQEHLPKAALVFDRFHVMKLFNDKLTALRRELHREATDGLQKKVLKGTRWLLLRNPENLNAEKREHERLEEALSLNKPLATAYYLKEELRLLWEQPGAITAELFLRDWCRRARASGIKMLMTFANTLEGYRSGILAWYDHPISTGPLEGVNNKIKTLKRTAYGYRNESYFELKILAIHQTEYALVG
jgi:transposase